MEEGRGGREGEDGKEKREREGGKEKGGVSCFNNRTTQ